MSDKEIVGYITTEQGHKAFIDSVIKQILTPEDYKRYQALPDTAISRRSDKELQTLFSPKEAPQ